MIRFARGTNAAGRGRQTTGGLTLANEASANVPILVAVR
jgi:hypothetical protein